MAFKVNFVDKFTVFIFILLCTETHIFASEDDGYYIDGGFSTFRDISVIPLKHARDRRQTSDGGSGTNTGSNPDTATGAGTNTDTDAGTDSGANTGTNTPSPTSAPIPTTSPDYNEWNIEHEDHRYYTTTSFIATNNMDQFWIELKDVAGHSTLSDSHRTAVTAKLPFQFPFYGHLIDNVTIATGGFMYMSPFLHKWLTATQYIAPLMANFDTRVGNTSEVIYAEMGKKFVVEWRDVYLKDQNASGAFQFQAVLHKNGSITFAYRRLPIPVMNISSSSHPVKIGLSDAFYFDTTSFGTKRRTIYEYHRVALNSTIIQEGTVVMINPLPTCNSFTDCESCVTADIFFECRWCGIINKCSTSVDWHRQKWLNAGCLHLSGDSNCSSIPNKRPSNPEKQSGDSNMSTKIGIIVLVVVVVVALIGSVVGWVYYAYTHPTSASGMWLMEHRPSQMKAKMSNMKFWKRNGTTGDKYAVESTA
ncbi:Plexin domain-containing protein 2 [Mactra antiquata]